MKILLIQILILTSFEAFSHARLKADGSIVPRNNNAGLKVGPCGNVPRTNSNTVLTAGETITLTWEETIDHPGYYEFSISEENDENFVRMLVIQDDQDGRAGLPHQYSAQFTVPDIRCDNCTFRMIQYMTENPNRPRLYFSCADIQIVGGNNPPGPMPNPVPPPPVPMPPEPTPPGPTPMPPGPTPTPPEPMPPGQEPNPPGDDEESCH